MAPIILAVNAGSSSVKVTVYKAPASSSQDPQPIAQCSVDGLTAPPAKLKYQRHDADPIKEELDGISSQDDAFKRIWDQLEKDKDLSEIQSKEDIKYACHRIVHGGDYPKAQFIDRETYHHIEQLSDLAPLHNAPALNLVHTCTSLLPKTSNLAFFDTSFHSSLPRHISTYPLDPSTTNHNGLRKYGFHGLSYASILRSISKHLSTPSEKLNLIALHLGSGASACAIQNGHSFDTTMGLTPLSGLPGATRSGDVDPSLIFHYTHRAGRPSRSSTRDLHLTYAEEVLNKDSGWKALTGTTDFGEISTRAEKGGSDDEDGMCKLAFDLLVDRIVGYVGAYFVRLEGKVDALVFAGGIGEKGVQLRAAVGSKLACLGFTVDKRRNENVGDDVVVEIGNNSEKRVLVVQTDEQSEMARGCVDLINERMDTS